MTVKLRDYQQIAIDKTHDALIARGHGGALIVMATGMGKTLFAWSYVAQHINLENQRVLFLVNTQDLVYQAESAFKQYYPDLVAQSWTKFSRPTIGKVMNKYNDIEARIIVGTPQTLSTTEAGQTDRLKELLKYGDIDLIIIDEAHYSASLSYLNFFNSIPDSKRLGITATPQRSDGLGLQQKLKNGAFTFDSIPAQYSIKWGIEHGYLCPILPPVCIQTDIKTDSELDDDNTNNEDFLKALDLGNWIDVVANGYAENGGGRKGVFFMPSVRHSRDFCFAMQERGYRIAHIDGEMCITPDGKEVSSKSRYDLYKQYNEGKIQLLTNFNVLTTGWDAPSTSLIVIARPTTNPSLYAQMIGRGTRIKPKDSEHKDLLILDFAIKGIKIVTFGTLFGNDFVEKLKKVDEDVEMEELTDEEVDEWTVEDEKRIVDGVNLRVHLGKLFDESDSAWHRTGEASSLGIASDRSLVITNTNPNIAVKLQEGINNGYDFLNNVGKDHHQYKAAEDQLNNLQQTANLFNNYALFSVEKSAVKVVAVEESFTDLLAIANDVIAEEGDPTLVKKSASWRKKGRVTPPTDKQRELLIKMAGLPTLDGLDKDSASRLITHMLAYSKVRSYLNAMLKRCGKYGGTI